MKRQFSTRLSLPANWQGQRYFSPDEWARIKRFLSENPSFTIVDYLTRK